MEKRNRYISVKDTSKYLNIPLRTVYRLVEQGKINSIRIGGKIMCLFSDVEHSYEHGTNLSSGNLRRDDRINTNLSCRYSINMTPFKNVSGEGILKNLSIGGVFVYYQGDEMNKVDVDDPVDLCFVLTPGENEAGDVTVKARVLRKTEKGIALKFRRVDEKAKESIAEYVG